MTLNPLKEKIESAVKNDIGKDSENLKIAQYLATMSEDMKIDTHFERKLSRKLEIKEIELTRSYLKEFEKINEVVQKFDDIAHRMNSMCLTLYQKIENVRVQNASMVKKSAKLQERKQEVEERYQKIDDFLTTYSLKKEELQIFEECQETGRLCDQLFKVLERAETIRDDCRILVQDHSHVAAFEILEQMQDFIELGTHIIHANLKREFLDVNNDALQKKLIISKSFQVLQESPELLQIMLETYSKMRSNDILHQFTEVSKTPANMCTDPIRSVTDMLTYIHDLIENEQELIRTLLSLCDSEVFTDFSDEILDTSLKSLCVPFKIRVEKLLSIEKDAVTMCKLGIILGFYRQKFAEGHLTKMLTELVSIIKEIAIAGIRFAVNSLMSKMSLPKSELLPVPEVRTCLVYYESLIETKFFEDQQIFEMVIAQLIQTIQMSATRLVRCSDISIFTINCLTVIKKSIRGEIEMINAMIESNEDVLVSESLSAMLETSGILELYQKLQEYKGNETPPSQLPGLEADRITICLEKFADFLHNNLESSKDIEPYDRILENPERHRIRIRIMTEFLNVYKYVIETLENPANKFSIFHYLPVDQVEHLILFSSSG